LQKIVTFFLSEFLLTKLQIIKASPVRLCENKN